MKTVFVIDDSDTNLSVVEDALEDHYAVMTIPSAAKMFEMLGKLIPDIILLDIEMPGMDGFEALRCLKASKIWMNIPVILLSARSDEVVEVRGFEMGAVDFITKPFSEPVLLHRIRMHINIGELIAARTAHLWQLQNNMVFVLADMVENRDKMTGGHIERTTAYVEILVNALVARNVYAEEIVKWDIDTIVLAARLHDIGKISISDTILNKPDKLSPEEFELVKTHALCGEQIIEHIIAETGEEDFLNNARLFAGYHHENWDGTGYPHGLKGTDIPLQGRLMAIADVYDALVSERPNKKSFSNEEAVSIIVSRSGTQFDPAIVDVFCEVNEQFKAVKG